MKEKEAMPLVSVIVPMRNAERFISATLASILRERDIPLEVVVVDDGSTDASLNRVQQVNDQRVRVINGPCQGVAAAVNAGIAAARGEIMMRCDADDLFPPQRIAQQTKWLAKHPEFGAVCGCFSTINIKGQPITDLTCGGDGGEITEELRNGETRTHFGTFAVRTEVLRAVGGNREYFQTAEDIDLQLRLGELCRVWFVPDVRYNYRLHETSLTHTQSTIEREFFELTAREFQQQRRTQGSDDLQRGCPPPVPQGGDKSKMKAAEHIQGLLMGSAWLKHKAGNKQQALITGVRSVIAQPSNLTAWRSLVALAVKPVGQRSVTQASAIQSS